MEEEGRQEGSGKRKEWGLSGRGRKDEDGKRKEWKRS